jgi:hypothetical protein
MWSTQPPTPLQMAIHPQQRYMFYVDTACRMALASDLLLVKAGLVASDIKLDNIVQIGHPARPRMVGGAQTACWQR